MQPAIPMHKQHAPAYLFLGVRMKVLLGSADTGRQFSLIEGIMSPGGDGGLHVHAHEDESMHLLSGELEVTIGARTFTLVAGESYFAPRNVPHRLRNRGARPARGLLVTTPGGFDEFVSRAGAPIIGGVSPPSTPPTPEQIGKLMALAEEFGIAIIAPPDQMA
jgi:mannose-6-phosphate isomerase-like protein (cupin superfamily)